MRRGLRVMITVAVSGRSLARSLAQPTAVVSFSGGAIPAASTRRAWLPKVRPSFGAGREHSGWFAIEHSGPGVGDHRVDRVDQGFDRRPLVGPAEAAQLGRVE